MHPEHITNRAVAADLSHRLKIRLRHLTAAEIIRRAEPYERQFGIKFAAFAHFPGEYIQALHLEHTKQNIANVTIVPPDSNLDMLRTISEIANEPNVTDESRQKYLDAFLSVYRNMSLAVPSSGITVAPRREGMLLARELGWLTNTAFVPHMKRIPLDDGLAVGIEYLPRSMHYAAYCQIFDGAIASGATAITLMELFSNIVCHFDIYTVHCPQGAINAMASYAAVLQKGISLCIGYVSGVLNKKFYAVSAETSKVIVGDVGDMITPILDNQASQ